MAPQQPIFFEKLEAGKFRGDSEFIKDHPSAQQNVMCS
jgi:hypothetical protein